MMLVELNRYDRECLLIHMGQMISSKERFMACEAIAPIISLYGQPKESIDVPICIEVSDIIRDGLRELLFGPTIQPQTMLPIIEVMIEKLCLWEVH